MSREHMSTQYMSDALLKDVLDFLGCSLRAPTVRYLNQLIHAYVRRVPWESVSRIVKRQLTSRTTDCPRYPEEFWRDAMKFGTGGTCFESSLAFYSLLISLGYQGYLTVNDMGATRACHAAVVLVLKGRKYLVDITIPVHRAVHFNPNRVTRRCTFFHNYAIRPMEENAYQIERSHHTHRYAFTLIDIPVPLDEYRAILEQDYNVNGFFLRSVVMVKVIDDKVWRFFSDQQPYKLESFNRAGKNEFVLSPATMERVLAERFQMPEAKIATAFSVLRHTQTYYEHQRATVPVVVVGRIPG